MRIVVALGGNALLRRGEAMSAEVQQANVERAARAIAPLALAHELVVTHGNGPQIGLLALQQERDPTAPAVTDAAAAAADGPTLRFPLDILGAETEGMIGYLLEQALDTALPDEKPVASLLTRVRVDANDPAFDAPTKLVGPGYASEAETRVLTDRFGWRFARDGERWRRVVPSPRPVEIVELPIVSILLQHGVTVVCAGGGGIPVVRDAAGRERGIEAVVDKDHAAALLARQLEADALLLLTDVASVQLDFGAPSARAIRRASPASLADLLARRVFPAGSMGPKVEAACAFVEATGGFAAIGALEDASELVAGRRGTRIEPSAASLETGPI